MDFHLGVWLGHIVFKEGIGTDPEKIEAMLEAQFPTTKRRVLRVRVTIADSFFGFTGSYRRFIERYVMIGKPLTRFLKDKVLPPQATPDALEAFDKLKQTLFSAPILRTPIWEKLFLFLRMHQEWSKCNSSTVG